jgi:hypothetical protein
LKPVLSSVRFNVLCLSGDGQSRNHPDQRSSGVSEGVVSSWTLCSFRLTNFGSLNETAFSEVKRPFSNKLRIGVLEFFGVGEDVMAEDGDAVVLSWGFELGFSVARHRGRPCGA